MKGIGKMSLMTMAVVVVMGITSCGGGNEPKETKKKVKLGGAKKEQVEKKKEPATDVGDPMQNKGIGPVKSITLGALDQKMVEEGKILFEEYCTACHKVDKKFVGPSPKEILKRRTPEWVMNMILNPEEMIKEDPLAKQVLMESNMAVMANQNLTEDEARKILEYFRTLE